jgi:cytoskeletal protein RodZ
MDDFGGKLRQARERRGISLRQIAASTKISAAALEALERNDISKLPGGIFSRAFVRSYAVEVGLDPEETVREFLERFDQEPPPSAETLAVPIPEQERNYQEQQRRAARTLGIAGVALVVIVVAAFFILRNRGKQPAPAPGVAASPESTTPPAAPPARPTAPAAEPRPAAAAPSPKAAVVPAASLTLDVHPTSECWISLTVDGKKLFARVMKPGEHESHTVEHEAVVEIGDAGAFAYSVNGRPGKPVGDVGQVKTLKVTPATAAQYVR